LDRELFANLGHGIDHSTVVPSVGEEEDGPPGVEVALLGPESSLCGLDVGYPGLPR